MLESTSVQQACKDKGSDELCNLSLIDGGLKSFVQVVSFDRSHLRSSDLKILLSQAHMLEIKVYVLYIAALLVQLTIRMTGKYLADWLRTGFGVRLSCGESAGKV